MKIIFDKYDVIQGKRFIPMNDRYPEEVMIGVDSSDPIKNEYCLVSIKTGFIHPKGSAEMIAEHLTKFGYKPVD